MDEITKKKIAYIIACVNEFARGTGLRVQEAYIYLLIHQGIDFLMEHYEAEHLLSFDEVLDDLKMIARQSGGKVA